MGRFLKGVLIVWVWVTGYGFAANYQTNKTQINTNLPSVLGKEWRDYWKVSPWGYNVILTTGAGYRDNATLSHYNVQPSSYIQNVLEVNVYRASTSGPQVVFYLMGDDLHYLHEIDVVQEQTLYGFAQIKQKFSSGFTPGLTAQYVYQDRMVDVSGDPVNVSSIHVIGHTYLVKPSLRYDFSDSKTRKAIPYLELSTTLMRQDYDSPLDDYWETGPNLSIGLNYRMNTKQRYYSDISISGGFSKRVYDSMLATDRDGVRIAGNGLEYDQFRAMLSWRHYFDVRCFWRNTAKLGILRNEDNGSGFYNYTRYSLSEQVGYRDEHWNAQVEMRVSLYDYDFHPTVY
ncbi:MAG: hypothetical protein N2487_02550, partial [Verrucomicrobiae bacterium]|nr:hypothetical protein [Verrucomicrobiae bacterium]